MACNKDHTPYLNVLETLPESQAVIRGRHRCAGCAYDAGYAAGVAAGIKAAKEPPLDPDKQIYVG